MVVIFSILDIHECPDFILLRKHSFIVFVARWTANWVFYVFVSVIGKTVGLLKRTNLFQLIGYHKKGTFEYPQWKDST